jgi:hypothetical protein
VATVAPMKEIDANGLLVTHIAEIITQLHKQNPA